MAQVRERRGAYRVFDRKPQVKRQRDRYRCKRKDHVNAGLQETGSEHGVD